MRLLHSRLCDFLSDIALGIMYIGFVSMIGLGLRLLAQDYHERELAFLVEQYVCKNDWLAPNDLADWTPQRVEARYDSGLAVVSTLGQNGNLQYVVRDLDLPVGAVFRNWNGQVKEVL